MTVPDLVGRDVRISLADFAGNFVELGPYQARVLDAIEAIPPEMRDKIMVVSTHDGRDASDRASLYGSGKRGDRIVIDDPRSNVVDGAEPDWPNLKLEELTRMEPKHITAARDEVATKPIAPRNRKERRAEKAKARKLR